MKRCNKKRITVSLAIAATMVFGSLAYAQCDSGCPGDFSGTQVTAPGGYSVGGGCGCDSNCNFGYPGTDCGNCRNTGGHGCFGGGRHFNGKWKDHVHHLSEIHKRDYARNQAWPKPFQCADRQLYFAMWDAMLDRGYRCNCLFTETHFDKDTNALNSIGKAKLANIFKNSPSSQKVALVQSFGNQAVVDARLQQLQSTIDQWYGSETFVEVAATDIFPTQFSGSRVFDIQTLSAGSTPPPAIPVASGTGSTSDVGVGN